MQDFAAITSVIFRRLTKWNTVPTEQQLTNGLTIVTLIAGKEKTTVASRAIIPVHEPQVNGEHCENEKMSRKEAAKELASLVEKNMEKKGLSQEERTRRVGRFAAFVDSLKKLPRKR